MYRSFAPITIESCFVGAAPTLTLPLLGHASLAAEHGFCYRLGSLPGVRLLLGRGLMRAMAG